MSLTTTVCYFLLSFTLAYGTATPMREHCEGDTQCLPGYYCYLDSGLCVMCIDCAVYFRNKLIWKTCAKRPSECGTCLSGFEEDILAEGQKRDFCLKSVNEHASPYQSDSARSKISVSWAVGVGLFIIATMCYAICWKSRNTGNNRLAAQVQEPPPPPYSSLGLQPSTDVLSNRVNDSNSTNCCSQNGCNATRSVETSHTREHHWHWQQCKEESLQQAFPFRYPGDPVQPSLDPLLQDSDDESNDSDHESSTEDILTQEQNIDLQDETTMPSDWTPYPCPENCSPIEQESNEACSNSGDAIDRGDIDTVSEPPQKKRREDETAASTETADSQ
ncbi:uncharacterized protein LOC142325471 isoform X2 [Lycorma delicatula]